MVKKPRNIGATLRDGKRAAGIPAVVAALLLAASVSSAQESPVHYWHQGVMPPGAIGGRQLQRGGPLPGFFQPVEIKAPPGVLISLAVDGRFQEPQPAPVRAGMLIGQVYRFKVMNVRLHPGIEVFPTIEVIDRLYAPRGEELRFAIPIDLTNLDLVQALEGKFVTRVIYLEDPRNAFPVPENPKEQLWFDVAPGQDPLAVADVLGRPVAILRMGARVPEFEGPGAAFLYGSPPLVQLPPRRDLPRAQPKRPAAEAAPAEPVPAPAPAPAAAPAPAEPAPAAAPAPGGP